MPLTGTTVDVPLIPLNEQEQITAVPQGQLRSLTNAICKKFTPGGIISAGTASPHAIQVAKRNGYESLGLSVANPQTGLGGTAYVTNPTILATLQDKELVTVSNSIPYTYSDSIDTWEQYNYLAPTTPIRTKPVFTGNGIQATPDSAAIGDVYCRVWNSVPPTIGLSTCQISIQDKDGTILRAPQYVSGKRIKATQSVYTSIFYVFTDNGTNIFCQAYSPAGYKLGTQGTVATLAGPPTIRSWDIYSASTNQSPATTSVVWLATQDGSTGTNLISVTYNGTTCVGTTINVAAANTVLGCSFLTNDTADGFLYLTGQDTSNKCTGWKINTSGTIITTYDIDNVVSPTDRTCNIAGYRIPGATASIMVHQSKISASNQMFDKITPVKVTASNVRSEGVTLYTIQSASRAFALPDGNYYSVVCYNSVPTVAIGGGTATSGQPTYFLIDLLGSHRSGMFEHGIANMSATHLAAPADNVFAWTLSTGVFSPTGDAHVALCYNAETVNQFTNVIVSTRGTDGHFSPSTVQTTTSVHTVGVKDYTFINDYGTTVEYQGDLFIPGTTCTDFSGQQFTEQGIWLAPEAPTLLTAYDVDSGLSTDSTYSYILVFEYTAPNGDRIFSAPSTATIVNTGSDNVVYVTGTNLSMTNRNNVTISVYRAVTDINGTTTDSTIHYKVTNDLVPVVNSTGTLQFTYIDMLSDAAAAVNEILYTESGQVEHEAAPAFNCGAVLANRVWLAGYDNAIWFSSEKQEGNALWFSSGIARMPMPIDDPITSLGTMDGRLIIFCERSIWQVEISGLPNPTGTVGSIPTPQRIPANVGGLKYNIITKEGLWFTSSSDGAIWNLDRTVTPQFASRNLVDTLANSTVMGLTVDKYQRIYAPLSNSTVAVWDNISAIWSIFSNPLTGTAGTGPVPNFKLSCSWKGNFTAISSAGQGWTLTNDTYSDYELDAPLPNKIITRIETQPIHLGGIKNYKRVWKVQFWGETKSQHNLIITIALNDNFNNPQTRELLQITNDTEWYWEIEPDIELCSSMSFVLEDDFTDPVFYGEGFTFEMISFYLGLEKGLNRLTPTTRRIPPGTSNA